MPPGRPTSRPRDSREFVRMSVSLPRSPKLLDTSDPARCGWLFTCGVMYAREARTDGVVRPDAVARTACVPRKLVAELVRVGMWHEPGHTCPRCPQPPERHAVVHDYADHNQTRDEIEAASAAAKAAADARWKGRGGKGKPPAGDADPDAPGNAEPDADRNAEAEAELEKNLLLTYVGRLAGSDASARDGLPAEVIASWQERAGPKVDLITEARAYLVRYGTSPARNPGAAWAGWLTKARERADVDPGRELLRLLGCSDPECSGGWLAPAPDDDTERPRPCPTCRPHIRPAEEAS